MEHSTPGRKFNSPSRVRWRGPCARSVRRRLFLLAARRIALRELQEREIRDETKSRYSRGCTWIWFHLVSPFPEAREEQSDVRLTGKVVFELIVRKVRAIARGTVN